MKYPLVLIVLCFVVVKLANAQNAHSLYFMSEMSQRHEYNPSFVPEYGYVSIPVGGKIQVAASSNVGVSDLIYDYNDEKVTFMHSSVNGDEFLNKLNPQNYLKQSFSTDILSCGFFLKKNQFISFGLTLKERLSLNLPRDLFALAKLGLMTTNDHYDLSSIKATAVSWLEASAGYSYLVNDRLRLGAKFKLLSGLSAARISYDKLDIDLVTDLWAVDALGESLIMSHSLSYNVDENGEFTYRDYLFDKHNRKPSGIGAAVDLGFTYRVSPDVTVASAIADLGFLYWFPSSVKKGVSESSFSFDGFREGSYKTLESEYWHLRTDIERLVKFKETKPTVKYYDPLLATLSTSIEYRFYKNKGSQVSCGLLNNIYYGKDNSDYEIVGALNAKPFSWLSLTTTCAFLQKNSNRFGLAINVSPKWINLFVASDFIALNLDSDYLPVNAFTCNVQAGVSIPLYQNKPPYRYKYKDYPY